MKRKIVYVSIILLIVLGCIFFFIYNKKENNSLDDKAINLVKEYVKTNNIDIDNYLYVELGNIDNNDEFKNCHNGSGVFIKNDNGKLDYNSFLSCDNYITKINNNKNISLDGLEILILNKEDEFIDPGYKSSYNVFVVKDNYGDINYVNYYVSKNDNVIETAKRIIIYTEDKEKNIDGNDNNEYPVITLYGGEKINSYYNTKYDEPGFHATDETDGDITDKVIVKGNVTSTKIGEYQLSYYVMNSKGNYAIIQRTINVINSDVNLSIDLSLSTEEITPKIEIILKIDGMGYNYTVLPNERTSKEKEIRYLVTENGKYSFKIYDINDEMQEKEIVVNNIGEIPKKEETVFTIGYPPASSNMQKIPANLLIDYFVNKGFTSKDGQTFKIFINNENYEYNISSGELSFNNDYVICDFYATPKSILGSMSNTITLLSGSGERRSGAVGSSRIPANANLNDDSLLIVPRKNNDYNMSHHPKMVSGCTKFGMFLAGVENENSIIGFSEGAQAAARTVSYNSVNYSIVVIVNGSAYYTSNEENLISNYQPFQNMEIILLEAKNNNNWNTTIIKTINNFLRNGVSSDKIKLFTSDNELISTFSNKVPTMIVTSSIWSGHGSGYRIINDSNILSYLSSK